MQATLIGFGAIFALAWLWDQLPHRRHRREFYKEYRTKHPYDEDWGGLSTTQLEQWDRYAQFGNPYNQWMSMDEGPERHDGDDDDDDGPPDPVLDDFLDQVYGKETD